MSDTSQASDGQVAVLDLGALKAMLQDDSPARIVIATDWSRAAVPFALAQAWADILPAEAPAQLVFAVPHDPGDQDLAAVGVILEEISTDHDLAPITIESFHEVVGQPYDTSVVPLGDGDVVLIETASAITRMHGIASGALEGHERNQGNLGALARRLSNFTQ